MESRLSGLFRDELIVGSFLLKISILSFPILIIYRKNLISKINEKIFVLIYFSIIIFFIFLTGERISFLQSLIILIVFIFVYKIINRIFLTTIIILSFSTIVFLYYSVKVIDPTYEHATGRIIKIHDETKYYLFEKQLNYTGSIIDRYLSLFLIAKSYKSQDYFILNQNAFLIGLKNPVFGNGHKSFRIKCSDTEELLEYLKTLKCSTHPHNIYMQIFAEAGFLSLILFISFILVFLSKNFKKINKDPEKIIILFSLLIIYFNPINITGNFFNNWYSSLFYYMMSVIYLFSNAKNNK